jgi:hypothetical protein
MATWAERRRRGRERIDLALKLLWGFAVLRWLLEATQDAGPFLLVKIGVNVLFLLIIGGAIRRGESFTRVAMGLLALAGAALHFWELSGSKDSLAVILGGGMIFANVGLAVMLLDGRQVAFYLREQQLHTRYRRQRRQAPLRRASA